MADATTFAPPAYTPPADFAGRHEQTRQIYKDALVKTQLQRSNLYANAGFKDGTTQIDPSNGFGGVQQLLHSEGQALSNDDHNAMHRGLSADQGLGAQAARNDMYAQHLGLSNISTNLLQGVAQLGQQDTESLHTRDQEDKQTNFDEATWNSGNSAYNVALAQYLKGISANQSPANTPQAGIGTSQSSYLPPSAVAAAAAKSTKPRIGKPGNSGIHAQ